MRNKELNKIVYSSITFLVECFQAVKISMSEIFFENLIHMFNFATWNNFADFSSDVSALWSCNDQI